MNFNGSGVNGAGGGGIPLGGSDGYSNGSLHIKMQRSSVGDG